MRTTEIFGVEGVIVGGVREGNVLNTDYFVRRITIMSEGKSEQITLFSDKPTNLAVTIQKDEVLNDCTNVPS